MNRYASGKGGRNIFSILDADLVAALDALRKKGIQTSSLERVHRLLTVERDDLKKHFSPDRIWLVISLSKMVVMTGAVKEYAPGNWEASPLHMHELYDDVALQVAINLQRLRNDVDARAQKLLSMRGKPSPTLPQEAKKAKR